MRVLLINPPFKAEQRYGEGMAKFGPTNEPLGLAYIGAMLEKHGNDVTIWDGMVEDNDTLMPLVDDADLIGVSILTPMYEVAKTIIQKIRKRKPDTPIVAGGAHPTVMPEETLKDLPIDYVVVGEGERAMLDIADGLIGPCMVKLAPVKDLDDLPMPARHLLPMDKYQMTRSRSKHGHAYTVSVARGCPFDCAFCCRIFGKKVRFHSVERIIDEIQVLHSTYGAKEINLEADTLTISPRFVNALTIGLIKTGLNKKVRFTCESRVDTVTKEMLQMLKKAGCWQISYGVESGSQRLLDLIDKGITLEKIQQTFKVTKQVGINIRAFFILGLPTETRDESEKTIRFARKLAADWSQFTLCTPFPGTKLQGICATKDDWSAYQTHGGWADSSISYVPEGRTQEEMKALQKKAYRSVYLTPSTILRKVREIDSRDTLKSYWDGFILLSSSKRHSRLVRVTPAELRAFAGSHYVDSPVYADGNLLVRELQWRKLEAMLNMYDGDGGRCIDLGCGNGVLLPSLSKMFDHVTGYDLHVGAARDLVRHYKLDNVDLVRGDGYKLPWANNSIDTIFATSCLEHFKELDDLIKETRRVLAPSGRMFFLVPSENVLYRIGRKILGYTKPADHYWTGREVLKKLNISHETSYPVFPAIYQMGVMNA